MHRGTSLRHHTAQGTRGKGGQRRSEGIKGGQRGQKGAKGGFKGSTSLAIAPAAAVAALSSFRRVAKALSRVLTVITDDKR